jgi:hypothetical protein
MGEDDELSDMSGISYSLIPSTLDDASQNQIVGFKNGWTPEIVAILDKIRMNSMKMSEYHNVQYHRYKYYFYYYCRIPLIVLSGINTFVAIGLQSYTAQSNISVINALLSLFCGVITSIEMLINLQKKMENELQSHKEYYRLALHIYKVVKLDEKDRATEGRTFLNARISDYDKLILSSNVKDTDYDINEDEFVDVVIHRHSTHMDTIKQTCRHGIHKMKSFRSKNTSKSDGN